MAEGITKPLSENGTKEKRKNTNEVICEPSGLLVVHNAFIKFDSAFCDVVCAIHAFENEDFESMVMHKIDDMENVFLEEIRPLIPDACTFSFINQSMLSKISFIGDALERGETKDTVGSNLLFGETMTTLPMLQIANNNSLYILFNVVLSMLIKFFAILHGFETICSRLRGFSLISDSHRLRFEKESIAINGLEPKTLLSRDAESSSSTRLKAEELRILKTPSLKRGFDLRCFVLSKNMFTSAAQRLQREWSSPTKVASARMKLRKNVDLLDRLRRDITVNLGTFVASKETYTAYSLLLELLTSLRYEFIYDSEELLSFFTCHPPEGNRYFEHVRLCIRYLDGIVSRGSLRYVGNDSSSCLSRVGMVRLDAHEELNFIIHSLIAVLHCIRAVICHDITPRVLSASVNECFIEVLSGKLCPKWNAVLEAVKKDSPSFKFKAYVQGFTDSISILSCSSNSQH